MSTSAICGSNAILTGITGATEMVSWSIDLTVDAVNATSMASAGWSESIACLLGATGTVKALHNFDVGPYTLSAVTGTGAFTVAGSILVSKVTCETDVAGIVSYTGDFTATGTITITADTV
jgi:hypothetical protein